MSKPTRPKSASFKNKASTKGRTKSLAHAWDLGLDWPAADPQRPTQPYSQSDWVFVCVSEIIKAAQSIPMVLSTQSDDIVESGPAFDLLLNNPKMPISRFVSETAGYLALYRECYWVFLDKDILKPTQILVCGPNQVAPDIQSGVLVGYWLTLESGQRIPLLPEDVWPILGFNPDSKLSGVGPAKAGKLAISTAYQAAMLNESTLANGGKLGTVIVYPAGLRLDDDERRSLVSQFEARHGGARNAGKTAILTGGADVKNGAFSMVDLQMLDLRMMDAKTICALMGVPAAVAGLDTEAQYANGPAQQRFIVNTIVPLLAIIAENVNLGLMPRFRFVKHVGAKAADAPTFCGSYRNLKHYSSYKSSRTKARQNGVQLFAWFTVEDHPTIAEMIRGKIKEVVGLTSSGLTLNAIIDAFNLPFEHFPWGDEFFMPMGMATATQIVEGAKEPLLGPSLPEGHPVDEVPPAEDPNKPVEDPAKPEEPAARRDRKSVV
jgi:HK97 family phage portal protein